MKVLDSAIPGEAKDYPHSHSFILKSPQGSTKLDTQMSKEFEDVYAEFCTRGVIFRRYSDENIAIGPFPSLSEVSSIEVGKFLDIAPKRVFAFILLLTRGVPITTDHRPTDEKERPKARSKDKPRAPWL